MKYFALALLALGGCSAPAETSAPQVAADTGTAADVEQPDTAPAVTCAPPPPSMCKTPNEGSVIRGVARFDPSVVPEGATANLALFLHHRIVVRSAETKIGGHPHAYKYLKNVDTSAGAVPFSIDLCQLGTAMWSEENCGFNLVVMLDLNGTNNPAKGMSSMTPEAGEVVAIVPLDISCHTKSPCLDVELKCKDGEACTTFVPTEMSACKCAASTCPSDDKLCN
jgi:hypothetical protein